MDFSFSEREEAFRREVREFLAEHHPSKDGQGGGGGGGLGGLVHGGGPSASVREPWKPLEERGRGPWADDGTRGSRGAETMRGRGPRERNAIGR